tara:strand:- start:583 stop:1500 length:918 start_codon:yes stop_codon:yes gene_type:complete
MKVLVTGGSGFVGRRLQKEKPEWVYLSSSDCDLLSMESTTTFFEEASPDAIVHLAGIVGGIKHNTEKQAEFLFLNTRINTNVIESARRAGVPRVLASLSTCAFPDKMSEYPFVEEDLFSGPPADTNFSYSIAKRHLHVMCAAYRKQYGLNYSTFSPSNIYGPADDYESEYSHFVPALIKKVSEAASGTAIELWGDGSEMRQQLYVDDLAKIIPVLLERHNSADPIIVAPNENLTIDRMAKTLVQQVDKEVRIIYNNKHPGQQRKDGSNSRLMGLLSQTFKFTSFEKGVGLSYKWFSKEKGRSNVK